MQQNFSDKNKSHLIRLTDVQKKKARRRLIGSIFLLLIALVVLLNVTSKVTPIEVEQPKVEIKNSAIKPVASTPTVVAKPAESSTAVATNAASAPAKQNSSNIAVVTKTDKVESGQVESSLAQTMALKPRLIVEQIKSKPTPEDILNGETTSVVLGSKYYVQLFASTDKNKLIKYQDTLADKGIKTIIQSVDTPGGIVYRLRVGPFTNKDDANSMLDTVNGVNDDANDNQ